MALKVKETISPVIMSDAQIDKLPNICRLIVRDDREIEAECCKSVVSFDRFKSLRSTRREHIRTAAKIYNPLSVSGPKTTV